MIRFKASTSSVLVDYSRGRINKKESDLLYSSICMAANNIQSPISKHIQVSRALKYSFESNHKPANILDTVLIIQAILRTRGLLRWTSLNIFSKRLKKFERSYFLSRMELFWIMAVHYKFIINEIWNHFSFVNPAIDENLLRTYSQNDYFNAISRPPLEIPEQFFLFVQPKLKRHIFNRLFLRWLPNLSVKKNLDFADLILELLRSDSAALCSFLLEYGPDSKVITKLEESFPDLAREIDLAKGLTVIQLPDFDKTFDEKILIDNNELNYDTLSNVEIWHQRFIIQDSKWLQHDSSESHHLPFVAGHWQFVRKSKFFPDKVFISLPSIISPNIEEAIFLSGRADENWYHMLLDTLPRYLFMQSVPENIPILIRSDLPETTRNFISRLIGRKIVELRPNSKVQVGKLHLIIARSTCFDSIIDKSVDQVAFSPNTIRMLSNWIKNEFLVLGNENVGAVFINRRSRQRRLINQGQIQRICDGKNIKILDDGQFLYVNQVDIFASHRLVATPGGAVLANLIFMEPNSRVLCLRSSRQRDLDLWKKLSSAVGVDYSEIRGFPTYHGSNPLRRVHSNYVISPFAFRKRIISLTESTTN